MCTGDLGIVVYDDDAMLVIVDDSVNASEQSSGRSGLVACPMEVRNPARSMAQEKRKRQGPRLVLNGNYKGKRHKEWELYLQSTLS